VVAARLYARLFITKAPGFDDVIIVVALLLGIGSSAISIYSTEVLYIGHHAWDVPPAIFPALRLNSWLGQWFSTGMLSAVKISLLLFYRRLSVTFSNRFLWATWIGIIYNIGKNPTTWQYFGSIRPIFHRQKSARLGFMPEPQEYQLMVFDLLNIVHTLEDTS
jgi:hypothetical protein